jgi:NADH:ubiquinone oxidoreductase subunit 6 (subunit J)
MNYNQSNTLLLLVVTEIHLTYSVTLLSVTLLSVSAILGLLIKINQKLQL